LAYIGAKKVCHVRVRYFCMNFLYTYDSRVYDGPVEVWDLQ